MLTDDHNVMEKNQPPSQDCLSPFHFGLGQSKRESLGTSLKLNGKGYFSLKLCLLK